MALLEITFRNHQRTAREAALPKFLLHAQVGSLALAASSITRRVTDCTNH